MTTMMHSFLRQQAPKIAGQIVVARNLRLSGMLRKADLSQDEIDAIDAILATIDFTGWAVLVGDVEPLLANLAQDTAYKALVQVGIDVDASEHKLDEANSQAVAYAQQRAAEMVGMRRDELGRLVPNPDAKWQITDSTRDFVRVAVRDAIANGDSVDDMVTALVDSYAFSKDRARMIARTEINMASNAGQLAGYRASGVVEQKVWLTADDDLVDEEDCAPNGEQGPIPLDDDFQSGDDAPPAHPNCRCALAPYVTFNNSSADADSE